MSSRDRLRNCVPFQARDSGWSVANGHRASRATRGERGSTPVHRHKHEHELQNPLLLGFFAGTISNLFFAILSVGLKGQPERRDGIDVIHGQTGRWTGHERARGQHDGGRKQRSEARPLHWAVWWRGAGGGSIGSRTRKFCSVFLPLVVNAALEFVFKGAVKLVIDFCRFRPKMCEDN